MEDKISRGYSKYGSTATALQTVVKWRTPSDLNFVHYRVNWLFRRNSTGFVFLLRICIFRNTVLFPKSDVLEFLKYFVWLQRKKYVFQICKRTWILSLFADVCVNFQGPCTGNQQSLAHSRLWDAVVGFLHVFAHMMMKLAQVRNINFINFQSFSFLVFISRCQE